MLLHIYLSIFRSIPHSSFYNMPFPLPPIVYYQPYTVYCTCTESICSHYMYLGLQCVGVSCSNHFLSPAGNAGYSVLVSCSEKIVQSLSEDPKALALHLLSAGLITVSILEKTNEYVNETKREKATRLYTALLGVVKHHPHKYHEFVSTLRLNPLHTDLVTQLDSKYT